MVFTLTEDTTTQSEPDEQDTNQISEKKFINLSDFEVNFYAASDLEIKFLQRVRF